MGGTGNLFDFFRQLRDCLGPAWAGAAFCLLEKKIMKKKKKNQGPARVEN